MTTSVSNAPSASASWPALGAFADFVDVVAKARDAHQRGESERALGLAKSAETLATHLDPPRHLEAARACNELGVVFFESGYTRSAIVTYERARAVLLQLDTPEEDLLASVHNNLGQARQRMKRLPEAQAEMEAAIAILRRIAPGRPKLGFSLDNLGSILGERGELDAAERMHQEALDIFQRHGGPFDLHVATTLGNLSNLHRRRQDPVRAEAFRLRALDAHERISGLENGATLLDLAALAELYRVNGDGARTDALMNLLLAIGGEKPRRAHRNLAEMLDALARSAFSNFRLDLAERLASRVVELLEAIEGPQAPETLKALHLLANVNRATGHLGPAEQAYHRVRSGYEALQMRDEAIAVTIDLGKFYRDTGAHPVAEKLFRDALESLRRLPQPDPQAIASALGNLGLACYEMERHTEADEAYGAALAELDAGASRHGERPWLLFNRGMLKYHLGDYSAALTFYEEARRLWIESEGEDHPFVATASANLALVHWATGAVAGALAALVDAERLRDREMSRILAVGSERKRAAYARELQGDLYKVVTFCLELQPRPDDVARFAAQMLLRRKGRVLDAIAHTFAHLRESVRPEDQTALHRLQTVRQEIAGLLTPVLATRRPPTNRELLGELRAEEDRLEAALSYRGALHQPGLAPTTLAEIQACLPSDGTLIEILRFPRFDRVRTGKKTPWLEEHYAAVVITPAGVPQWFDLGPAAPIDTLADEWRSLLRHRLSEETHRNDRAAQLHAHLIAPLQGALAGARQLFVAADGRLVLIPFGELRDADGRTLSTQFVIGYLSSGRDLRRLPAPEAAARDSVVFAAPDYEADPVAPGSSAAAVSRFVDRARFAPLPGSKDEGVEIAGLLEGARLLTGSDATVAALRVVRRPLVLHVATHGIFVPLEDQDVRRRVDTVTVGDGFMLVQRVAQTPVANPMFCSGLALSGANRAGAGILTAQEIAGLDLRGTQLVVLSACETGLGAVKQGEEFAGLRRALAIAGAMTQVTSLWKVDDTATRVLMGHYYRCLLQGHGRTAALQLAQRRVAGDEAHPEWRHPAYWAAFVSAGDWGPLTHPSLPRPDPAANP